MPPHLFVLRLSWLDSFLTFSLEAPRFGTTIITDHDAKGSAPLKLPTTHCLKHVFRVWLGLAQLKNGISLTNPWYPKAHFKFSHLCYASIKQAQYEATVKLLGSFRLTAGRGHLHPHCIFTEQVLETVSQSLRLSCTSELTRQGIALFYSF
jgi:hypothetical protein